MWRAVYEKVCLVARQWTPRPLSSSWREIGAVRVAQYTPEIEGETGLHIVGDATTLVTGESFIFPVRLGGRLPRRKPARTLTSAEHDVLVAVALEHAVPDDSLDYNEIFGAKTQGYPYHTFIVALGLLVEHMLPGIALVHRDISLDNGEQARRGLSAILDEEIALPVVLDEARMRQRLAPVLNGAAVEEAVSNLGPLDSQGSALLTDLLGMLCSTPAARTRHDLEYVVLSCPDPRLLAPETRQMLRDLVEARHASMVRYEVRQRVERWGAAMTRELIARQTSARVRLTSATWDAIEAADLDELTFVYTAICMHTHEWHLHHAIRAVIENHAIRRA